MHRAGFAIVLAGRCELLEAQTNRSDRNPPRRHDRRMILDSETKAVELPDDHGTELRLWLRLLTCTTLI